MEKVSIGIRTYITLCAYKVLGVGGVISDHLQQHKVLGGSLWPFATI
jgi:hypothetical protein